MGKSNKKGKKNHRKLDLNPNIGPTHAQPSIAIAKDPVIEEKPAVPPAEAQEVKEDAPKSDADVPEANPVTLETPDAKEVIPDEASAGSEISAESTGAVNTDQSPVEGSVDPEANGDVEAKAGLSETAKADVVSTSDPSVHDDVKDEETSTRNDQEPPTSNEEESSLTQEAAPEQDRISEWAPDDVQPKKLVGRGRELEVLKAPVLDVSRLPVIDDAPLLPPIEPEVRPEHALAMAEPVVLSANIHRTSTDNDRGRKIKEPRKRESTGPITRNNVLKVAGVQLHNLKVLSSAAAKELNVDDVARDGDSVEHMDRISGDSQSCTGAEAQVSDAMASGQQAIANGIKSGSKSSEDTGSSTTSAESLETASTEATVGATTTAPTSTSPSPKMLASEGFDSEPAHDDALGKSLGSGGHVTVSAETGIAAGPVENLVDSWSTVMKQSKTKSSTDEETRGRKRMEKPITEHLQKLEISKQVPAVETPSDPSPEKSPEKSGSSVDDKMKTAVSAGADQGAVEQVGRKQIGDNGSMTASAAAEEYNTSSRSEPPDAQPPATQAALVREGAPKDAGSEGTSTEKLMDKESEQPSTDEMATEGPAKKESTKEESKTGAPASVNSVLEKPVKSEGGTEGSVQDEGPSDEPANKAITEPTDGEAAKEGASLGDSSKEDDVAEQAKDAKVQPNTVPEAEPESLNDPIEAEERQETHPDPPSDETSGGKEEVPAEASEAAAQAPDDPIDKSAADDQAELQDQEAAVPAAATIDATDGEQAQETGITSVQNTVDGGDPKAGPDATETPQEPAKLAEEGDPAARQDDSAALGKENNREEAGTATQSQMQVDKIPADPSTSSAEAPTAPNGDSTLPVVAPAQAAEPPGAAVTVPEPDLVGKANEASPGPDAVKITADGLEDGGPPDTTAREEPPSPKSKKSGRSSRSSRMSSGTIKSEQREKPTHKRRESGGSIWSVLEPSRPHAGKRRSSETSSKKSYRTAEEEAERRRRKDARKAAKAEAGQENLLAAPSPDVPSAIEEAQEQLTRPRRHRRHSERHIERRESYPLDPPSPMTSRPKMFRGESENKRPLLINANKDIKPARPSSSRHESSRQHRSSRKDDPGRGKEKTRRRLEDEEIMESTEQRRARRESNRPMLERAETDRSIRSSRGIDRGKGSTTSRRSDERSGLPGLRLKDAAVSGWRRLLAY
ncbi:MAG: hypothetical protein M1817_004369 [Caeruleum heppii]|nr:MAG: hypothetical protein M1817_004369 [Caeruleum heppii]